MNLWPSAFNPKGMNGEAQPFNIHALSMTFEPQTSNLNVEHSKSMLGG
jgi:hypothetical protein